MVLKNTYKLLLEKKKILDKFRPFPQGVIKKLHEQFLIEWTYNSNAIEGNTLSLRETALVLREGITIKGKSLREHFEVTNHRNAIWELEKFIAQKGKFSEEFILNLHSIILSGIEDSQIGVYRSENVRIIGARLIPPSPYKIGHLMKDFIRYVNRNTSKLNPVALAAEAHYRFVAIHPFIDGNGRTARLIMNFILMQAGYPPAIILTIDRKKYYEDLNSANLGNLQPFSAFVVRSVERSVGLYLEAIQPIKFKKDQKKEYISLSTAAKYSTYSQEYLSLLARTGRIHAIKKGRNWYITREDLELYTSSRSNK